MLYTIVPIEQVLGKEKQTEAFASKLVRAQYMGEDVLLCLNEEGDYSIAKLLSTNPQSYLKAGLSPGSPADIRKIELKTEAL